MDIVILYKSADPENFTKLNLPRDWVKKHRRLGERLDVIEIHDSLDTEHVFCSLEAKENVLAVSQDSIAKIAGGKT